MREPPGRAGGRPGREAIRQAAALTTRDSPEAVRATEDRMQEGVRIAAPLADVNTARLQLRRFRNDDLDALAAVFAKPEVWRFPYGRGLSRSETEAFLNAQIASWESDRFGCWLAIERQTGATIGYLGLSIPTFLPEILPAVEVGWRLDPDAWGRGYATEGAAAALEQGFRHLGLREICSLPQTGNPASSRVCERLGMRWERTVRIPASERRGPLLAEFFVIKRNQWKMPALPS
jgi:RimJ/RimL family protein N-acetyltransferase